MSPPLRTRWSALPLVVLSACAGRTTTPFDAAAFGDGADISADGAAPGDGGLSRGWANGAVIYRLAVRSFQDSDGDGQGDFAGLTSRLDYLAALGVDAVLLLPIARADDDASGGFAPTDLFDTEAAFGTPADFAAFTDAAHARGLRVLVDVPLDAVSAAHPYFLAATDPTSSAHRDDFVFAPSPCPPAAGPSGAPVWQPLAALGQCFWAKGGPALPEWNYASSAVLQMASDAAVFWLDRGADGVELDGAGWLVDDTLQGSARPDSADSLAVVTEIAWRVHVRRPGAVVLAQPARDGSDARAALATVGVDVVRAGAAFQDALYGALAGSGSDPLGAYFDAASTGPALVAYSAGDERSPPGGRSADVLHHDAASIALAALALLAAPGDPMVYYGDEIGLGAGAPDASGARSRLDPMAWDASPGRGFTTGMPWTAFYPDALVNVDGERGSGGSALETYRNLIAARHRSAALSRGTYTRLDTQSPQVLAFLREAPGERALVVLNFDVAAHQPAVDLASAGITTARVTDLRFTYVEPNVTPGNAGAYGRLLPARSGRWLRVE